MSLRATGCSCNALHHSRKLYHEVFIPTVLRTLFYSSAGAHCSCCVLVLGWSAETRFQTSDHQRQQHHEGGTTTDTPRATTAHRQRRPLSTRADSVCASRCAMSQFPSPLGRARGPAAVSPIVRRPVSDTTSTPSHAATHTPSFQHYLGRTPERDGTAATGVTHSLRKQKERRSGRATRGRDGGDKRGDRCCVF